MLWSPFNSFKRFAYLQGDTAKDLTLLEPLVSLGRLFQRIDGRYGNLQARFLHGPGQSCEFPRTGLCVVGYQFNAARALQLGFDPVRIGHAAPGTDQGEQLLELLPATERQDSVDAIGGKLPQLFKSVAATRVKDLISTQ